MSPFFPLPAPEGAFSSLLLNFALQATLLITLSWAALRWLGSRWSAANRHVLLLATALLLPCLIPCTLLMEQQGLTWAWLEQESTPASASPEVESGSWKFVTAASPATDTSPVSGNTSPVDSAQPASASLGITGWLFLLWISGLAMGLVWLAAGLLHLNWVAMTSRPATPSLQKSMDRHRERWVPGARVKLLTGQAGEIPMTWGWITHYITLPPESSSWSASLWRAVLRHELSHVARRDFAWLTLARTAVLVCWFHPLAWWLIRELSHTAELACDDLATRTASGRATYAQNLVRVVSQCRPSGLTLASPFRLSLALSMGRASALRQRVESLLDDGKNRATYRRASLMWQAPLGLGLLLLMGAMTACKEKKAAATAPSTAVSVSTVDTTPAIALRESRIYRLSEAQRTLLLGSSPKGETVDPFGPKAGQIQAPSAKENEKALRDNASRALQHFLHQPHLRLTSGETPALSMPDSRTLIITTDVNSHNAIGKYLAERESEEQVFLRTYVLEVDPGWLHWRDLGLTEPNAATGLQVQGVLTAQQGQKLMELMQSEKAVQSLTAAPSVTTRSGQRANVEMVREFIYPTEFDPPHVLEAPKGADGKPGPTLASLPIVPTTPTAFEMRPVGLRMECNPTILPDKQHHIELYWEITDVLGFVNYGTPIKASTIDKDGKQQDLLVSENKLQQPIFESMKLTTSIVVPDGGYAVLGGLRPKRQSPAELDQSMNLSALRGSNGARKKDQNTMYVLILQPTLHKTPEKK